LGEAASIASGTIRLPCSSACRSSAAQYSEASEAGLATKTKLSEASIESSMSRSHLEAGGMSSQSTQTSRPSPVRNACNSRTKPASLREYETKTSATPSIVLQPGDVRKTRSSR
jgi:hypothetical protein